MTQTKDKKTQGLNIKRFSPFPERISDTNLIFDMMLHDLDLARVILPDEIENLKAEGKKLKTKMYDQVLATLAHKNGAISRIEANRVFGSRARNITITTEREVVEADLLNKTIYIRDFASPTPSTVPVRANDQLTEMLTNFIEAIKGKKPLAVLPEDAYNAIILAERIEKAC